MPIQWTRGISIDPRQNIFFAKDVLKRNDRREKFEFGRRSRETNFAGEKNGVLIFGLAHGTSIFSQIDERRFPFERNRFTSNRRETKDLWTQLWSISLLAFLFSSKNNKMNLIVWGRKTLFVFGAERSTRRCRSPSVRLEVKLLFAPRRSNEKNDFRGRSRREASSERDKNLIERIFSHGKPKLIATYTSKINWPRSVCCLSESDGSLIVCQEEKPFYLGTSYEHFDVLIRLLRKPFRSAWIPRRIPFFSWWSTLLSSIDLSFEWRSSGRRRVQRHHAAHLEDLSASSVSLSLANVVVKREDQRNDERSIGFLSLLINKLLRFTRTGGQTSQTLSLPMASFKRVISSQDWMSFPWRKPRFNSRSSCSAFSSSFWEHLSWYVTARRNTRLSPLQWVNWSFLFFLFSERMNKHCSN